MTLRPLVLCGFCLAISACSLSAADRVEGSQSRQPNEVRAADYGDAWPLTVDRAVLDCKTIAGRPMATVRTFDGREYGINGAAKGRGGFPPVDPIWKTRAIGTPTKVLDRMPEPERRRVFAAIVGCEDDGRRQAERETTDVMKQVERERALTASCKAGVRKREKVTEAEARLVSSEGAMSSWPPLQPTRVSIGPLIDAALKLCR
jgi:hypothetical protein